MSQLTYVYNNSWVYGFYVLYVGFIFFKL